MVSEEEEDNEELGDKLYDLLMEGQDDDLELENNEEAAARTDASSSDPNQSPGRGVPDLSSVGLNDEEMQWVEWIQQEDREWGGAVVQYIIDSVGNERTPILPNPSCHIGDEFQKKFGIDLFAWLGKYNKNAPDRNATTDREVVAKGSPVSGKNKRKKKGSYHCGICKEKKIEGGKPHICRPTKDQVIDEVLRHVRGEKYRRAGSPSKKRRKKCGKCRFPKLECKCLDEYGRLARKFVINNPTYDEDDQQEIHDLIASMVEEESEIFRFSEEDGRRVPSHDPDAGVRTVFEHDYDPWEGRTFLGRPLPPQAQMHIEELRQGSNQEEVRTISFRYVLYHSIM